MTTHAKAHTHMHRYTKKHTHRYTRNKKVLLHEYKKCLRSPHRGGCENVSVSTSCGAHMMIENRYTYLPGGHWKNSHTGQNKTIAWPCSPTLAFAPWLTAVLLETCWSLEILVNVNPTSSGNDSTILHGAHTLKGEAKSFYFCFKCLTGSSTL